MQRPRFRFHLKWLLIAIAAIAIAFWVQILWQRHETYQRRIAINEFYGRQFREAYQTRSKNVFAIQHGPVFAATPELRLRWAEYHEGSPGCSGVLRAIPGNALQSFRRRRRRFAPPISSSSEPSTLPGRDLRAQPPCKPHIASSE